jgi:hypothetical protein
VSSFPTSPAQRRLLLLHALDPTGFAYSTTRCFRVRGPFDQNAFRAALDALIARHEPLRTVFLGLATQYVRPTMDTAVRIVAPCRSWDEALDSVGTQRFDVAEGPLLAVTVIPVGVVTLLAVRFHLLAADGWSMRVFFRDLAIRYESSTAPLPRLAVQYVDWAAWQAGQLTAQRRNELRRWWREYLSRAPLSLDLGPPTAAPRTGARRILASPVTHGALEDLARRSRRSTYAVLAAACAVVLAARTGQDEVIVGVAVANREEPETRDLLGFFVNSLPLRISVREPARFVDLVHHVAKQTAVCHEHKDLPFDDIVTELAAPWVRGRCPLVQASFAHHYGGSLGTLDLAGCVVEEITDVGGEGRFELMLRTRATDDGGLDVLAEYNGVTVDDRAASEMLSSYHGILTTIAANPDITVGELMGIS